MTPLIIFNRFSVIHICICHYRAVLKQFLITILTYCVQPASILYLLHTFLLLPLKFVSKIINIPMKNKKKCSRLIFEIQGVPVVTKASN